MSVSGVTLTAGITTSIWGALQVILVIILSFAVLTLIASFIRYQLVIHRMRTADPGELNPADVFKLQIIERLGIVQRDVQPVSVMFVSPYGLAGIIDEHGSEIEDRVLNALEESIRAGIRKKDFFMRYDKRIFGLVISSWEDGAGKMASRIVERISRQPLRCAGNITLRIPVNIGMATYPENTERGSDLVAMAMESLDNAFEAGPGQHRTASLHNENDSADNKPSEKEETSADQKGIVDDLTGVLKEDRLETALQKYVALYRKDDLPVSVLYLSIDNISRYLDNYGRKSVDTILRGIGLILTSQTRESDLISRYGESDFILAMDCVPAEALVAAQRLSAIVKRAPFKLDRSNLRVSLSIGVAGFPDHGKTPRALFEGAETAVQHASNKGGNLCLQYHHGMKNIHEEDGRLVDTF